MIYLRYGHWLAGSITWQPAVGFNETQLIEKNFTVRNKGVDLQQKPFNTLFAHYKKFKVVISADELANPTKYSFIKSFYAAHTWQISETNNFAGTKNTDYYDVDLDESGELPVEFIENHKFLPQVTFNLTQKV